MNDAWRSPWLDFQTETPRGGTDETDESPFVSPVSGVVEHSENKKLPGSDLLDRLDRGRWFPHLDHKGALSLANHGGRNLPGNLAHEVKERHDELIDALRGRTAEDVRVLLDIVAGGPVLVDEARRRFIATGRNKSRWCWALVHSETETLPGDRPGPSGSKADSWTVNRRETTE